MGSRNYEDPTLAMDGVGDNENEAMFRAALSAAAPKQLDLDEVYTALVPDGARLEVVDPEPFLPAPRRTSGQVAVQTVDDLVKYVARHDDAASTTLWVDEDHGLIVAVIDDHAADGARWGEHRAQLRLRPTPEWLHWTGQDNQLLEQVAFAQHIEDGLLEIVEPDGATMLELAQSIEGSRSAEFRSAERLHDGNIGVSYVETTAARAGQTGQLEIPERFVLGIAPFLGEEPAEVRARLRWRLRDGHVVLGYKLDHPERVVRQVIDAIADRLDQTFTGDRVFIGVPRPAPTAPPEPAR